MTSGSVPILALIPARRGSKGIPNKNRAIVAGRPLIDFTITAAKKSIFIDQLFVSSDCQEILNIARSLGATPISRPDEFSTDDASSVDVVSHFLTKLPRQYINTNPYIIFLQPTSPLRNHHHIDEAINLIQESTSDSLISVVEADKPPQKAFQLNNESKLVALIDEKMSNARRQDLPKCYFPNGAIYIFRVNLFIARNGFPSNGSLPYIMSKDVSIDVDQLSDLPEIEKILRTKNDRF
jgi:CMP-N-acetylneuraminic acid synthetase